MARQILGMVATGPIIGRFPIAGDAAEVWEIEVRRDTPITAAPLKDITLLQSLVAAIEREDFVKVPGADDQLQPGDTAVVLVQRESVDDTLALFQQAK